MRHHALRSLFVLLLCALLPGLAWAQSPAPVEARSVITILEVPAPVDGHDLDGYLSVQQVYTLGVAGTAPFDGELRLSLPQGAFVHRTEMLAGDGTLTKGQGEVIYRGPITPGAEVQLVLLFFVQAPQATTMRYEQEMGVTVRDLRVAFVRDAPSQDPPLLDIGFENHPFSSVQARDDAQLLNGRNVLVGLGTKLEQGASLSFSITGLPFGQDGAAPTPPAARMQQAPPLPQNAQAPNDSMHGGGAQAKTGVPETITLSPGDVAGKVPARVRILRHTERVRDSPLEPLAGTEVELIWSTNEGRTVARTYTATTDENGWADFGEIDRVRNTARFALEARVGEGGMMHRSAPLIERQGRVVGEIRMVQVDGDPGLVVGGSLITIMRIPETILEVPDLHDYVAVEQVVELNTTSHVIYDTRSAMNAKDVKGLVYTVPIKAQAVHARVIGGMGEVTVVDNKIVYRGLLFPASEEFPRTRLLVSFILEAEGSTLDYEQEMALPFADVRVTFLRDTVLRDHPVLDLEFVDAPFGEISDTSQQGVLEGRRVIVGRDLFLGQGDVLSFQVRGLPYPDDPIPWIALAVVFAMLLGGVALGVSEVRKARERERLIAAGAPVVAAALDSQIEALFLGLTELELDYEDGVVSESEYITEQERLKTRLTLLKQRREDLRAEKV